MSNEIVMDLLPASKTRISTSSNTIIYNTNLMLHGGSARLDLEFSIGRARCSFPATTTHLLRIVTISPQHRPCQHLPIEILRSIAFFAQPKGQIGWRKELLDLSLVCKAWRPVVDLFFEDPQPNHNDVDRADIVSVANSLEKDRAKGRVIKTFVPWAYVDRHHIALEYFQAQLTIFRVASALRNITLGFTHRNLLKDVIRALSALEDVQNLRVSPMYEFGSSYHEGLRFSMSDILEFTAKWHRLETVFVRDWRTPSNAPISFLWSRLWGDPLAVVASQFVPSLAPARNRSRIKQLRFECGELTGTEILSFLSLQTPSTLQSLDLRCVSGLTNVDILAFLRHVAPTLQILVVEQCYITHNFHDEYAIDTAMPSLVSLETATLDGDLASELAISRKVQNQANDQFEPSISLRLPSSRVCGVAEALKTTAWRHIKIDWKCENSVFADNPTLLAAHQIAIGRGISMTTRLMILG
ncbi:hypothetical protein H0H93_000752 [Arthromyces matolae]|nr:hypothetical protein H0H93_000752 [Arthromyces matolae]